MAAIAKQLAELKAHTCVLETKVDELTKDVLVQTTRLDKIHETLTKISGGLRMLAILGGLAAGLVSVANNLGLVNRFWRK